MLTVLHGYSFRDYPGEHVLRVARAEGWPAIELASWHLDPADQAGSVVATVKQAATYGVAVHCVGYWGTFAAADRQVRHRSVESVCAIVEAAADAGVTFVNGSAGWLVADPLNWDADWSRNGSALASDVDCARVAEGYREVAACGAARGVRVAIEVHPNTVHDTVAATARLLRLIDHDNVTITLDPANAAPLAVQDRDPSSIDMVAERVGYFHLKNCAVRGGTADFTTDAAAGVIDNYRWLSRIAALPSVTAVCVEYCGAGDPHSRVAAARGYLHDTLRLLSRIG